MLSTQYQIFSSALRLTVVMIDGFFFSGYSSTSFVYNFPHGKRSFGLTDTEINMLGDRSYHLEAFCVESQTYVDVTSLL